MKVLRTCVLWLLALLSPFVFYVAVADGTHTANFPSLNALQRFLFPAIGIAMAFALLRRSPLVTLGSLLVGSALVTVTIHDPGTAYLVSVGQMAMLAISAVVGYVAARLPRRVSIAAAVFALGIQILAAYGNPLGGVDANLQAVMPTLATLAAWVIGNSVRARRLYGETLREQAAAQAVTAERLRIARELHDMVAHSISIIAIQAGMGGRVIDTQPAEARTALRTIEETSRETLAGLRRVLVGLRRTDSEAAPVGPAPTLDDVGKLAVSTRDAGVDVEVEWRGERRPVPPEIELSAYRIIQEAVTNVVRHAKTPSCQVLIEHTDDELRVEVTDDGHGAVEKGSGYGIAGMRERVALLHGEFSAGPRPGGGFRVTASLPL